MGLTQREPPPQAHLQLHSATHTVPFPPRREASGKLPGSLAASGSLASGSFREGLGTASWEGLWQGLRGPRGRDGPLSEISTTLNAPPAPRTRMHIRPRCPTADRRPRPLMRRRGYLRQPSHEFVFSSTPVAESAATRKAARGSTGRWYRPKRRHRLPSPGAAA